MVINHWNGLGDQLLDILEQFLFFEITKGQRRAMIPCPTGAADAMDIGLRDLRQVKIDNIGQAIDVNPTRRYICGHQDSGGLVLEVIQRALAGILGFVAMDGLG